MTPPTELRTRVVGLRRGREIDADFAIQLEAHGFEFADDQRRISVAFTDVDGFQEAPGHVTLYLTGGDVIDVNVTHDDVRRVVRRALDRAYAPPEFARSLRAVGDVREGDHAAHDRWFGPMLRARTSIEGVSDPLRQCALLDMDRLASEVERAIEELAAVRTGGDPARTRALAAMLEEETERVRLALAGAALAASRLEGSASDSRLADWRLWIEAVRALFRALDEAWPAVARVLRAGV